MHVNMNDTLKAQIINTIDETYLSKKQNKYTAYLGSTARDLVTHLLDRYRRITPDDLESKKQKMNEDFDSTLPITTYFKNIEDAVQFVDNGSVPFIKSQVLQMAYNAINYSGLYHEACNLWRKKPQAHQNWATFKQFFSKEYHDIREQELIGAAKAGFHSSNSIVQVSDRDGSIGATLNISHTLDNLALAATTYCDIVTQFIQSNATLTANNKILVSQIKYAIESFTTLAAKVGNPTNYHQHIFNPTGYCWLHGFLMGSTHSSRTCPNK